MANARLLDVENCDLIALQARFLQEKTYLNNVSRKTIEFYECSFKAFNLTTLSQESLNNAIAQMRKSGKSVGCVNAYLRGMRSFVNWAVENQLLPEKLTLKELKQEQRPPRTFSEAQVEVLLRYKPKTRGERRLLTIVNIGLDTGARISEILGLRVADIDLQNCLLTLHGKGNKTRIVPFSVGLRKVLFKYLNLTIDSARRPDNNTATPLVFTTRNGLPVPYTNVHKEFKNLLTRLGIQNVDGGLHALRRWFVSYCARRNVNPFLIMRLCGHERIETTQRYLRLQIEDLQAAHVSALQGGIR